MPYKDSLGEPAGYEGMGGGGLGFGMGTNPWLGMGKVGAAPAAGTGLLDPSQYSEKESLAMEAVLDQFGGSMNAYNKWFGTLPGKKPRNFRQAAAMMARHGSSFAGAPAGGGLMGGVQGPGLADIQMGGPQRTVMNFPDDVLAPLPQRSQLGLPGLEDIQMGGAQGGGPQLGLPGLEDIQMGGAQGGGPQLGLPSMADIQMGARPPAGETFQREPMTVTPGVEGFPSPPPPQQLKRPGEGVSSVPLDPSSPVFQEYTAGREEAEFMAQGEPNWMQQGMLDVPPGGVPLGDVPPREPMAAAPQRELRPQFTSAYPEKTVQPSWIQEGLAQPPLSMAEATGPSAMDFSGMPSGIPPTEIGDQYNIAEAPSWIQQGAAGAAPYNIGEAPEWIRQGVAGTAAGTSLGPLEFSDLAMRENPVTMQAGSSIIDAPSQMYDEPPMTLSEQNEQFYSEGGFEFPYQAPPQPGLMPLSPNQGGFTPMPLGQQIDVSGTGYSGWGPYDEPGPPRMDVGNPYGFRSNAPMGPPQMQVGQPYGFQSNPATEALGQRVGMNKKTMASRAFQRQAALLNK